MKRKMASFLMAAVMVASICAVPGLSANAEERKTTGIGSVMQAAEVEMCERTAAAEKDIYEFQDDTLSRIYQVKVEALGAELFPEYAQGADEAMISPMSVQEQSAELGTVVYSETKPVSDTEELTYVEFSSARRGLVYHKSWNNMTTSTAPSGGVKYHATIAVTVNGCYGSVYSSGFEYTINFNFYDWIDRVGECHDNFNMAIGSVEKAMEDATPARATIAGNVEDMRYHYTVGIDFQVLVGGNEARVCVDGIEI